MTQKERGRRGRYYDRKVAVPFHPDRELQHAISWLYHDDPDGFARHDDIREFVRGALHREACRLRAEYREATEFHG